MAAIRGLDLKKIKRLWTLLTIGLILGVMTWLAFSGVLATQLRVELTTATTNVSLNKAAAYDEPPLYFIEN